MTLPSLPALPSVPSPDRVRDELRALRACRRSGVVGGTGPRALARIAAASRAFGLVGGASTQAAIRHGDRPAVIDERGTLGFRELDERSNALANAWRARGLGAGDGIAILTRNHRGFYDAFFAAQKLGANAVLMNTEFAGPQLRDVFVREGARVLVHDDEFAAAAAAVGDTGAPLWRSWTDDGSIGDGTVESLIRGASPERPPAPSRHGTFIILTSGTTGTPKGANRRQPTTLTLTGGIVQAIPFRQHEPLLICPPVFHSLGIAYLMLALTMGMPTILQRRFRPDDALDALVQHRAAAVVAVPVMVSRMLDADAARPSPADLSALRILVTGGSQVGRALAVRTQEQWGDVMYNLYGSTEVALATIANPEQLRRAPDTVGPPTLGTRLRIIDEQEREAPTGVTGRIVVRNVLPFEGYTGGGGKPVVDGMMASGDVGHVDENGWLYIDGRDDSMIVSGGENVFPDEVEDHIAGHPDVVEVAAVGVDDDTYGQRLRVYVVRRDGADLDADAVRAYVKDHLARYKVPRDVAFIDALPRNPTGKVVKRRLGEIEAVVE
ncbi:MAG: AMP-binding protein [Solirubrobacteraceae bacterium]|nr:AMP-binding protein [Solirubrobacteraceae bacterium]